MRRRPQLAIDALAIPVNVLLVRQAAPILDRQAVDTKVECPKGREENRLLAASNWQTISFEHGPFVDPHSESLAHVVQTHPVRRR
jgi:hypothetical protein